MAFKKVQINNLSQMTSGRSTTLTLDGQETVVTEPGIRLLRTGVEVAKRGAEGTSNQNERVNMRYLSNGAWIISPYQYDIANIQENSVGLSYVIRASQMNFAQTTGLSGVQAMFQEFNNWAQSSLAGATYGVNVPAFGDYFIKKIIPATGSCIPNAGFDPSYPVIPYPSTDIPMDRIGVSKNTFRANQGFFLRWTVPMSTNVYTRYLFTFFFGQYAIVVGTVFLYLFEYCQPTTTAAFRWIQRAQFQQGAQGAMPGTSHSMGIFPHRSPDNINYIAFTDISTGNSPQNNTREVLTSKSSVSNEFIYKGDQTVRQGDVDPAPSLVTSVNNIRIDVRRDLRVQLQVSTLGFPTTATLIDDDTVAGGLCWTGNANPIVPKVMASNTSSTYTITPSILDGTTFTTFIPGTGIFPLVQFAFVSDGNDTPILWGYTLKQLPKIDTANPGSFVVSGKSYDIDMAAGDPQTESFTVSGIVDLPNVHTRLDKRERFAANLATTYTPKNGGGPVNISLSRGVITGNQGERKGVGRTSSGEAPDWYEYALTGAGMWDRLKEWVEGPFFRIYAMDPTAASNTILTWKITDAIRDCLGACGFPDSQINIPDLPNRFWPGQTQKLEDTTINPTANIAEWLVRVCRSYLGAFLHYEANAGAQGQWILIFGTPLVGGVYIPVLNFTQNSHGKFAPPTSLNAYPDGTVPYFKMRKSTRRPDANLIVVLAPVPATNANTLMAVPGVAANPLSYKVPGMSTAPDPNHPDYLGYCKKIEIIADYLYVPDSTGGYAATQQAVNWETRRLYDFLCHGQRIKTIKAPLAFIHDSRIATSASSGYRPLRFQDPVAIDGDATWLVKSVNPSYSNDGTQMANYELIQPIAGQHFFGFDGKETIRRIRRMGVTQVNGALSHSSSVGIFAPSPHKEHGRLELPKVRSNFAPLQNADGSFIPMEGWNTLTGVAG